MGTTLAPLTQDGKGPASTPWAVSCPRRLMRGKKARKADQCACRDRVRRGESPQLPGPGGLAVGAAVLQQHAVLALADLVDDLGHHAPGGRVEHVAELDDLR